MMNEATTAKNPAVRKLPRNVWVMTVTSFLNDVSSEMLLNLMPLFLFNVLGVRTSIVGMIEGLAEATASLLKAYSGWLSDRLGERKRLAVLGYALSTCAKPFLYFADRWLWVLGVRFTDRVGKGIRTAPRDALVADSIDENQRGLAFGLHRAGDTAGAVLGLIVALLIVILTQGNNDQLSRSTFQLVVLISMIPAVLAVLVIGFGAKDVERPQKRELAKTEVKRQSPRIRLRDFDRRFRFFLLVIVIFTLGNSSDAFLILRAQNAGLSVSAVMGVMILFNFVYALVSTPAGVLSDRIGRRKLLIGGWIFYALVYLGFARTSTDIHIWILMAAYGIYYGMTEGVAKAFVADLVSLEQRGTAYGLYNAAIGLMAFPASLIAGILWQGFGRWSGFGAGAPFLFGAVLALAASALLALMPQRSETKE
jgi:MFS family permease